MRCAVLLLLLCSLAFAQTYLLPWNSINCGGAPGTGTGYGLNGSAAQAVQGTGSATGYLGYWGFWVPELADTSYGWREKAKMPVVPSSKYMKDGGWLAFNSGNGLIYAAKGNKVPDYYAYFPQGDSWRTLALWPDGLEGKKPSKGAVGCADGSGVVFAVKGNNTQGFWKYFAQGDSWRQKANVPLGLSNKKVKGGSDMAWAYRASIGYAYLLKGYKNEFYKYFADGDSWKQMPSAPVGANPKYDKGSWLALDDDNNVIYAHKAKYHELYAYSVDADSWLTTPPLKAMPIPGSAGSRKAKDGSAGAWKAGCIYALKGANSQEFWKYYIQGDSWRELDTIPSFGSTGKKKKVKGGGDIVALPSALYATKGNKCNELWRYVPRTFLFEPGPEREGVMAGRLPIGDCRLTIAPNPVTGGYATVRFSPFASSRSPLALRIYDVAGRCVHSAICNLKSEMALDLRGLRPGVYLVKLKTDGFTDTRKLVVQR
jgi:hypothetical protein